MRSVALDGDRKKETVATKSRQKKERKKERKKRYKIAKEERWKCI